MCVDVVEFSSLNTNLLVGTVFIHFIIQLKKYISGTQFIFLTSYQSTREAGSRISIGEIYLPIPNKE